MKPGYAVAAAICAATLGIHLFVGSASVVQPLLAEPDLPAPSKWMSFYTWHMASVTVAMMGVGFVWAAVRPSARSVGLFLTALAGLFSLLCLYVALRAGFPLEKVKPIWLFAAVAVAGAWGALR